MTIFGSAIDADSYKWSVCVIKNKQLFQLVSADDACYCACQIYRGQDLPEKYLLCEGVVFCCLETVDKAFDHIVL